MEKNLQQETTLSMQGVILRLAWRLPNPSKVRRVGTVLIHNWTSADCKLPNKPSWRRHWTGISANGMHCGLVLWSLMFSELLDSKISCWEIIAFCLCAVEPTNNHGCAFYFVQICCRKCFPRAAVKCFDECSQRKKWSCSERNADEFGSKMTFHTCWAVWTKRKKKNFIQSVMCFLKAPAFKFKTSLPWRFVDAKFDLITDMKLDVECQKKDSKLRRTRKNSLMQNAYVVSIEGKGQLANDILFRYCYFDSSNQYFK